MDTPYDRGYRKITTLSALNQGEASLFRTGGSMLILHRDQAGNILAVDATSCVKDTTDASSDQLAAVTRCLGAADSQNIDWKSLLETKALPVEVLDSDVWVCVDMCAGS